MILQSVADAHLISDVVAVIVVLVTVVGFAYSIKNTADNTADKLNESLKGISELIRDHEIRIRDNEGKMAIVWNGYERRGNAQYFREHPRDQ
jgi:hypothetical protein